MNPILLKPTNDTGSQVIVNGEVLGNLSAKEYYRRKREMIPHIMQAYRQLDEQYDIIVLEGAGSPAEINLKQDDIVNMGMAKLAKAPVLLVGDIDRGGVFASLAGTLMLLDEDEKAMVKGLVINKFRGDVSILEPGLRQIEDITGKPVVGVVPYMNLDLEDEDSLSERFTRQDKAAAIDIAVVRLPRISNFTDFNSLECIEGVAVRYIKTVSELRVPDLVILPGTKNTMEDLLWLRQSGLEAAHPQTGRAGNAGLWRLRRLSDAGAGAARPAGHRARRNTQGSGAAAAGHHLQRPENPHTGQRPAPADLAATALPQLSHRAFSGYEIHMGQTEPCGSSGLCESHRPNKANNSNAFPFGVIERRNGEACAEQQGFCCGNVFGTYIHGIFDQPQMAQGLIEALCLRKGLDPGKIAAVDFAQHKEEQYNLLAQGVRESLDMDAIYRTLKEGI